MADERTYAEVGATLGVELPAGYHHLDERRRLGGREAFDAAGEFVLGWGLQRGAGLRVRAFSRPARWYSRLGGPVTSWMQRRYTERYLAAAERAVGPRPAAPA